MSYYYGTQHYTSIRQFLTTACLILNDHLQQNTILKQWGGNEGLKINKTRSNTHYAMFQSHCLSTPFTYIENSYEETYAKKNMSQA